MKNIRLLHAIGAVDGELLEECEKDTGVKAKSQRWVKWGAMAACLFLITGFAVWGLNTIIKAPESGKTWSTLPGGITPVLLVNGQEVWYNPKDLPVIYISEMYYWAEGKYMSYVACKMCK